jgi:hypothetical protein
MPEPDTRAGANNQANTTPPSNFDTQADAHSPTKGRTQHTTPEPTPTPRSKPEPTHEPTSKTTWTQHQTYRKWCAQLSIGGTNTLTCTSQKISQQLLVRHDFGGVSSIVEPTLTPKPTPELMPGAEFDTTPTPKQTPEPTTKRTPERALTCTAQKNQPKTFSEI